MNSAVCVTDPWLGVDDPSWRIAEAVDFGGVGKDDLLWRYDGGGMALWQMNAVKSSATPSSTDPGWSIMA
jgi:hypothetical protein